jgi:hypothetical protein
VGQAGSIGNLLNRETVAPLFHEQVDGCLDDGVASGFGVPIDSGGRAHVINL